MEKSYPEAIPLSKINIDDGYWNQYIDLIPSTVLPYQWNILNDKVSDVPPSYCIHNFKIAAGEEKGERRGTVFQDSDLAKWLEAVAYSLAAHKNPKLEKTADDVIALVSLAQCDDGYLNTYFTLVGKNKRWQNLTEGHELYVAGHFIEAAVAYYEATGKKNLLNIVCRNADLICRVFGPNGNQIHGYPGHPEIELALVRLYRVTGTKRYLELAKYFIDTRGQTPNYFLEEMKRPEFKHIFPEFKNYDPIYSQSHKPVREQTTAEGHAVRAVYLYCAMADIAEEYDDSELMNACLKIWKNIVNRRMYITGGIGSSGFWERFTADYDLPNSSNYSETCASIGLAQFGLRMAKITRDASYMDIVERVLYNNLRSGISLAGNTYFYVNPLEVWPKRCLENTSDAHVKPVRQKWFDVACCPTNIARTLTALGQFIYFYDKENLYVNLFIENETDCEINGKPLHLSLKTDFPRTGKIEFNVKSDGEKFGVLLRVPSYAENFKVTVDGKIYDGNIKNGYFEINRTWHNEKVLIEFYIIPHFVFANPAVHADSGKLAIMRGPEVYCLEETDNGSDLTSIFVNPSEKIIEEWKENLLGGITVLKLNAFKLCETTGTESSLCLKPPVLKKKEICAVPYGFWGNRKTGEMIVFLNSLQA